MNKKTSVSLQSRHIRHSQHYHSEGVGTVTILMAIATIAIIFYSIYSSI